MKRLLAISNLFPRPDQPGRGLYNAQLFAAMSGKLAEAGGSGGFSEFSVVCLVPEWRLWRWAAIRRWQPPEGVAAAFASVVYCPVFYLPGVGRVLAAHAYAHSLKRVLAERTREGDAVLTAWLYPDAVAVEHALRGKGRRLWAMVLGSDTFHLRCPLRRRAVLAAARGMEGLVCVSHALADRLRRAGLDASRVYTIENGVDARRFRFRHRGEARRELARRFPAAQWASDAAVRVLLFVGNLVHIKGPDLALEAFARLLAKGGDDGQLHLAMVGDGSQRRALRRRLRRLGLEGRVTLVGARPHEEIPLWMNAADCLCLTSRSEGMPNAVTEALACGLPVAARDVGACRRMLEGLSGARLVTSEDPAAFADGLRDLLARRVDREALARAHGRYTWDDQAARIVSLTTMSTTRTQS